MQGGVLSAYVFNVYINFILEEISCNESGCHIGITRRKIQAYADNGIIFLPDAWWTTGADKLFFVHSTKRQDDYVFSAIGVFIENIIRNKHLSVILSSDACITSDVKPVHTFSKGSVGTLNKRFHSVDLGVKTKL